MNITVARRILIQALYFFGLVVEGISMLAPDLTISWLMSTLLLIGGGRPIRGHFHVSQSATWSRGNTERLKLVPGKGCTSTVEYAE